MGQIANALLSCVLFQKGIYYCQLEFLFLKIDDLRSFYVAPGLLSLPSSRRSTGASLWITGLMYSVRLFITMVGMVFAFWQASLTCLKSGLGPMFITENMMASGFPRCSGCSREMCCDILLVSEFRRMSARC